MPHADSLFATALVESEVEEVNLDHALQEEMERLIRFSFSAQCESAVLSMVMATRLSRALTALDESELTGVDAHVPVPRGPVVERLAADGTLFAFFGIAHAGRGDLLHVVVQLQLQGNKELG